MKLSKSRRLLCSILSVISACAVAVMIISLVFSATVIHKTYTEKMIVTDSLVAECEAQLDASFEVLSVETGIPVRVFDQVKTDFPVADTLSKAYNAQFDEDNASLYSKNMAEYFSNLCTEYLDGNGIEYKKQNITAAADRAARLYSNALGMQNTEGSPFKLEKLTDGAHRVSLFAAAALLFCALLIFYLYSEKRKAFAYLLSGISAGGVASALAALLLLVTGAAKKITLTPDIYQAAYRGLMNKELLFILAVSLIVFAVAYFVLIKLNKKIQEDSMK